MMVFRLPDVLSDGLYGRQRHLQPEQDSRLRGNDGNGKQAVGCVALPRTRSFGAVLAWVWGKQKAV